MRLDDAACVDRYHGEEDGELHAVLCGSRRQRLPVAVFGATRLLWGGDGVRRQRGETPELG